MLSYRHAFHAGNHADVLKHFALCLVLQKLKEKNKPFSVFESHAGGGIYSTESDMALKTGENMDGIKKLLELSDTCTAGMNSEKDIPESLKPYIALCKK